MKPGSIHKPLHFKGKYIIIKLIEKLQPTPKFYSEVKSEVKRDYLEYITPKLIKEEYARLHEKYSASLNQEYLEYYE